MGWYFATSKFASRSKGLFDRKDPHVSPTQIGMHADCPFRWWREYVTGRKTTSREREGGQLIHAAAREIGKLAQSSKQEIGAEDVKPILRQLRALRDYGWYKNALVGLENLAIRLNTERETILNTEMEVSDYVDYKGRRIRVVGRIDLVSQSADQYERFIWDYKSTGLIPTVEDVAEDPQTSIYNWLYRANTGWNGVLWKGIHSIFTDSRVKAPADQNDVESIKGFVLSKLDEMLTARKYERTPNRWCGDCRYRKACKEYLERLRGVGIREGRATLDAYARVRESARLLEGIKEWMASEIKVRLDKYGKPIIERGYKAWLVPIPGETIPPKPATWREPTVKLLVKPWRRMTDG